MIMKSLRSFSATDLDCKQEDERRGSGSVAVPVSRGTLVQGERGQVILHFLLIKII